jgi:cephalosporin hydroxylase
MRASGTMCEFIVSTGFYLIDTAIALVRTGFRVALAPLAFLRQRSSKARFVDFKDRLWVTDLPLSRQLVRRIQGVKWGFDNGTTPWMHWRGVHNIKDPFEVTLYPLLLWELRPKTIIEIGSFRGGSALWMADQLQAMGIDCHIYSFDHMPEKVEAKHPKVTFDYVDSTNLASFKDDLFKTLPHPWLVIEDAHVNVAGVLTHLDQFIRTGDYLIVEDVTRWRNNYLAFKEFMKRQGQVYKVDTKYTDMFGYNSTLNSNAYLKKF